MSERRSIELMWFGHSTVLVDVAGVRVLTDPLLTGTVAHLRRRHPVLTPGRVDLVAISHVHMDHLHVRSLRLVTDAETHVVVPAGAAPFVRRVGAGRVTEVRAGDVVELGGAPAAARVALEAVQAAHSDRRGPHTRRRATALGYVLRTDGCAIYFAGDTGLFDEMDELGPFDVALLPIWGWGATLGRHHLDPTTAAEATERLRAACVIPIHWGTYSPRRGRRGPPAWLGRPLEEFRAALAARGLEDRLLTLRPGESTTIGVRPRPV